MVGNSNIRCSSIKVKVTRSKRQRSKFHIYNGWEKSYEENLKLR